MLKSRAGKRIVTFITTLAMVMSLVPASVFAASTNQVVKTGTSNKTPSSDPLANGKVKFSKTIAQVDENVFDITLKA